jgi:hypothetical protein
VKRGVVRCVHQQGRTATPQAPSTTSTEEPTMYTWNYSWYYNYCTGYYSWSYSWYYWY